MKSYLYVMVENIPMLLDSDSVYEILPLAVDTVHQQKGQNCTSGYFKWRDQVLPIINARDLLELPSTVTTSQGAGVVYRGGIDKPAFFLVIDEVVKILSIGLESFLPLPKVPEKTGNIFDKIYVDEDELRQVYRFRNSFSVETLENN